MSSISKSQVSRLCEEIGGKVKAVHWKVIGPTSGLMPPTSRYGVADGSSVAVILAIGVTTGGRR